MSATRDVPDVFAALAHPLRRRLMMELRTGPRSVGELAADMPVGRPAISEHLQVLRRAGLLKVETRGRERYHHLDPRSLSEVGDWLNLILVHWARQLDDLKKIDPSAEDRSLPNRRRDDGRA